MKESFQSLFTWLSENWIVVALVCSEIAALLPNRYNGILQGFIKFGSIFFEKKSSKRKK